MATVVATQLSRRSETYWSRSSAGSSSGPYGGAAVSRVVEGALAWLSDPSRVLAHRGDDGRYRLTSLGVEAVRSTLPLSVAAGVGQLVRDLLSVDPSNQGLAKWRPLDHLIRLGLLSERSPTLRPFSEDLATQIDAWMESTPGRVPVLYREWLAGAPGASEPMKS